MRFVPVLLVNFNRCHFRLKLGTARPVVCLNRLQIACDPLCADLASNEFALGLCHHLRNLSGVVANWILKTILQWSYRAGGLSSELLFERDMALGEAMMGFDIGLCLLSSWVCACVSVELIEDNIGPSLRLSNLGNQSLKPPVLVNIGFLDFNKLSTITKSIVSFDECKEK